MKPLIVTRVFRRGACLLATAALSFACSSDVEKNDDLCTPDDADGIISEPATVLLTVTDSKFAPAVVTTQNSSDITLTLKNDGTTPHSFVVDCLPTPNSDGCPTQSCFPSEAKLDPVAPGEEATIMFETPLVEGIYKFHSDVPEDTELTPGQFVIQ
ncbi:MAG: cupredoxin domain-containing protein [Pseudomonadota bacterium]